MDKIYKSKAWLKQKYWDERLSLPKIAELCNVSYTTIGDWMERYGINRRTVSESVSGDLSPVKGKKLNKERKEKLINGLIKRHLKKYGHKKYRNEDWLHQKYIIEELFTGEIAELCGVSRKPIDFWMKRFKIEQRSRKESRKLFFKKNPDYYLKHTWNQTKQAKEKISLASKANWQKPEYIKNVLNSLNFRPTQSEKALDRMTPSNVRYTGDGSWWRTLSNGRHKNPDFKITGQDKVIEVFGGRNYFHTEKEAIELELLYKQSGLDCLVLWVDEIRFHPQEALKKVHSFINI